jgi:flagellar hook-length control protein FliK
MTGINVLSTGAAAKSKDAGFSVSDKSQQGLDAVAMEFAAILSGWITQVSGQGQNSGYQSIDPAGKEANSGRSALLGLEGLQALVGTLQEHRNFQEVQEEVEQGVQAQIIKEWPDDGLSEVQAAANSLDAILARLETIKREAPISIQRGSTREAYPAGMPEQSQGLSPLQSELDRYKGVISELLKEMSGEIQEVSRIQPQFLKGEVQQKLELAMQRMNSGLLTPYSVGEATTSETTPMDEAAEPFLEDFLVQRNTSLGRGENVQRFFSRTPQNNPSQDKRAASSKGNLDILRINYQRELTNIGDRINQEGVGTPIEEENAKIGLQRQQEQAQTKISSDEVVKSAQVSTQERPLIKGDISDRESSRQQLKEETNKDLVSNEGQGIQISAKETHAIHTGVVSKTNQAIHTQIARDIYEKAFQARPQLKELEIHLHPAELGQVRISLKWEEGQVHLRMIASEFGTGQVLQSNLNELRDNLSQLGIQCGMLEMSQGNQEKNSRQQQGQEEASSRMHSELKDSQGLQNIHELEPLSGIDSETNENSRINVTA